MDGSVFKLAAQKGKVILIDFWAAWCGPCKKAIPSLKDYYNEFKSEGFDIIGISLDYNRKDLESFLCKEHIKWKIAYTGNGWDNTVVKLYGVTSMPSVWLIDKKGYLRFFNPGRKSLRENIKQLLSE